MKRHPMFMSIGEISQLSIMKIMVLSKLIYRFSTASSKLISFIAELQQTTLKFIRNKKIPPDNQNNTEQKEQCQRNYDSKS